MPAELTTPQAAIELNVTKARINQMVRAGMLAPVRKIGTSNLYRAKDVRRLGDRKTKPGPAAKVSSSA